jgi:anti-anti-sigma factor
MEIVRETAGNYTVACVKGRLDALSAPEFEKTLLDLIAAGDRSTVIDFSELDYISSAGLRSILAVAKQMRAQKGELRIAALQAKVKDIFDISGFNSILPIFDTVATATASG